jgi:hypothetical protein
MHPVVKTIWDVGKTINSQESLSGQSLDTSISTSSSAEENQ